ncbi:unnamed protein product [Amoebophrya sp. A25]|nr:unnamed protein product [Amoebophrya sp. A25]|eukprot:GSA25T00021971001.1
MGAAESVPSAEHSTLCEIEARLLEHARVPVRVRDLILPQRQESIHYARIEGRGQVGNGLPMVVIHGYGGGIGVYYRMMKFMAERWAGPIYFLDLPGMGSCMRKEKKFQNAQDVEHFFVKRLKFWVDSVLPQSTRARLSANNTANSNGATSCAVGTSTDEQQFAPDARVEVVGEGEQMQNGSTGSNIKGNSKSSDEQHDPSSGLGDGPSSSASDSTRAPSSAKVAFSMTTHTVTYDPSSPGEKQTSEPEAGPLVEEADYLDQDVDEQEGASTTRTSTSAAKNTTGPGVGGNSVSNNNSGGSTSSRKSRSAVQPDRYTDKFVLVAHSFGGYLSTALAGQIKDRIAGLVLLSPCFGFPKTRVPKESEKGYTEKMSELAFGALESNAGPGGVARLVGGSFGGTMFRHWVRTRFMQPPPEKEYDALVDYLVGINYDAPPGTEQSVFACFGQYMVPLAEIPLIERVGKHLDGLPIISFFGSEDWMDREGASYLGDVAVIDKCSHQMALEYPRVVARSIMYFCKWNIDPQTEPLVAQWKARIANPKRGRRATGSHAMLANRRAAAATTANLSALDKTTVKSNQNALQAQVSVGDLGSAEVGVGEIVKIEPVPEQTELLPPPSQDQDAAPEFRDSLFMGGDLPTFADKGTNEAKNNQAEQDHQPHAQRYPPPPPRSTKQQEQDQLPSKAPRNSGRSKSAEVLGGDRSPQPRRDNNSAARGDSRRTFSPPPPSTSKSRNSFFGGRTPAVVIRPEKEVTKEDLLMSKNPKYSKRPYKKIVQMNKRVLVWWLPNESGSGTTDIRDFRPDDVVLGRGETVQQEDDREDLYSTSSDDHQYEEDFSGDEVLLADGHGARQQVESSTSLSKKYGGATSRTGGKAGESKMSGANNQDADEVDHRRIRKIAEDHHHQSRTTSGRSGGAGASSSSGAENNGEEKGDNKKKNSNSRSRSTGRGRSGDQHEHRGGGAPPGASTSEPVLKPKIVVDFIAPRRIKIEPSDQQGQGEIDDDDYSVTGQGSDQQIRSIFRKSSSRDNMNSDSKMSEKDKQIAEILQMRATSPKTPKRFGAGAEKATTETVASWAGAASPRDGETTGRLVDPRAATGVAKNNSQSSTNEIRAQDLIHPGIIVDHSSKMNKLGTNSNTSSIDGEPSGATSDGAASTSRRGTTTDIKLINRTTSTSLRAGGSGKVQLGGDKDPPEKSSTSGDTPRGAQGWLQTFLAKTIDEDGENDEVQEQEERRREERREHRRKLRRERTQELSNSMRRLTGREMILTRPGGGSPQDSEFLQQGEMMNMLNNQKEEMIGGTSQTNSKNSYSQHLMNNKRTTTTSAKNFNTSDRIAQQLNQYHEVENINNNPTRDVDEQERNIFDGDVDLDLTSSDEELTQKKEHLKSRPTILADLKPIKFTEI